MNRRWTAQLHNTAYVRRGKQSDEMLVERCFFKGSNDRGEPVYKVMFADPMPMTEGKTGWALLAARLRNVPTIRGLHHHGPGVQHYVFDNGCWSVLDRLLKKYHALERHECTSVKSIEEGLLLVVVTNSDKLHECATGFWNGIRQWMDDEEACPKRIYVTILCARNGYAEILTKLPEWSLNVITYTVDTESADVLQELWELLGYDEEIVARLVLYRVLFNQGVLQVHDSWNGVPGVVKDLENVFIAAWKLITFSKSRWLSMGPSSCSWMGAELMGMKSLVQAVKDDEARKHYHIKGYSQATDDDRVAGAISAISSRVCDEVQKLLLKDGRLMKQIDIACVTISAEVEKVETISDAVFRILASLGSASGSELRTRATLVVYCSECFLDMSVLSMASKGPWCYSVDPVQGLRYLKESDTRPTEEASGQIWDLIRHEYSEASLLEILEEIGNLDVTTRECEHGHTYTTMTLRYHPELEQEQLRARAGVQASRILVTDTETSNRLERLEHRLADLEAARKNKMTGRQLFVQEALLHAGTMAGTADDANALRKHIIETHGEQYRALSEEVRYSYEVRAERKTEERVKEHRDKVKEMREFVEEVETKNNEEDSTANPWTLKACRWTETEKAAFELLMHSDKTSHKKVAAQRSKDKDAPAIPEMAERLKISTQPFVEPDKPAKPEWFRRIVWVREHFKKTVFVTTFRTPGRPKAYFAFLFAYQNPYILAVMALRRIPQVFDPSRISLAEAARQHVRFLFDNLRKYTYAPEDTWLPKRLTL